MADAIDAAGVLFHTGYFRRGDAVSLYPRADSEGAASAKSAAFAIPAVTAGPLGGWFDTDWRWMAVTRRRPSGAFGDLGAFADILPLADGRVDLATARLSVVWDATAATTNRAKDCCNSRTA